MAQFRYATVGSTQKEGRNMKLSGIRTLRNVFALAIVLSLQSLPAIPTEAAVNDNAALVIGERRELRPLSDGTVIDQTPYDGVPDLLSDLGDLTVILNPGNAEMRPVVEFDLGVIPKGKVIVRAGLNFVVIGKAIVAGDTFCPIEFHGFASNGVVELNDFHGGPSAFDNDGLPSRFEGAVDGLSMRLGGVVHKVDVSPTVKSVYGSGRKFVGFHLRSTGRCQITFGSLASGPPIKLVVVTADPM
jgi:hypothetical protein